MKVAITGHQNGIGAELFRLFTENGFECIGFDKAGQRDPVDIRKLNIKHMEDCDMFINNAWDEFVQVQLFHMVWNKWKNDDTKTIVNISSMNANRDEISTYNTSKRMLDDLSTRSVFQGKCRTHNVKFGWVDTNFVRNKKATFLMSPEEAAQMVYDTVLHKYYIPSIGIMAKK